jgi:hypothetical protein
LSPSHTDAHLLLNEQINASINRELNLRGIRIDEINGKRLDEIIKKESKYKRNVNRESEFDPFYYYKHELDKESVVCLKSNEWHLNVDFKNHYQKQEKVYKDIMEKLSKNSLETFNTKKPAFTNIFDKIRGNQENKKNNLLNVVYLATAKKQQLNQIQYRKKSIRMAADQFSKILKNKKVREITRTYYPP